jgi:hypothetical protein
LKAPENLKSYILLALLLLQQRDEGT